MSGPAPAVAFRLKPTAAGLFSPDDALRAELAEAGDRADERLWPMPLFAEYEEQLKSDVADVKNIGGRAAGSCTAATFLKGFIGDYPWAHIDIAGTAWEAASGERGYLGSGATGFGVRAVVEALRGRAAAPAPKAKKKASKKKAKSRK